MEGIQNALSAIGEGIASIANSIVEGFKSLFIPDENVIKGESTALNNKVKDQFPIVDQTKQLIDIVFNENNPVRMQTTGTPFKITAYGSEPIEILNLEAFEPFREDVHAIILGVSWALYLLHLYRSLPGIIGGFYTGGADTW